VDCALTCRGLQAIFRLIGPVPKYCWIGDRRRHARHASSRTHLRALAARCARVLEWSHPRKMRGRRECRVRAAPAVSCAKESGLRARAYRLSGGIRHPLRDGFTAYAVLSPATNSSCHRRRRIEGFVRPGRAPKNHRRLGTSNGCQNHTVLPYALASFVLRACQSLTRFNPPCDRNCTPTLSRPPHPIPRS
jgi:hypothetical protein